MAVVSVHENHKQRRSGIDKDGKLTHTRMFLVKCSSAADGTAAAITAKVVTGTGETAVTAKVPLYHEPHPKGDGTWVTDVSAEPHQDSDVIFDVTVNYSERDPTQWADMDPDPLKAPAEISYGAAESTESYFYDRSPAPGDWNPIKDGPWKGKPLTTSAGDAFEDTRERECSELTINVVTNEAAYNALDMNDYGHTINDEPMTIDGVIYPAHTLKLSPLTAEKVTTKVNQIPLTYYKVTKVVKYRRDGWNDEIFDEGYNQLDYTGDTPPVRTVECKALPIFNGGGMKVDKPFPLNGKGKAKKNPTDVPAVLEFRPYQWQSWGGLKWS